MKTTLLRLLALVLMICMLLPMAIACKTPEEPEIPGENPPAGDGGGNEGDGGGDTVEAFEPILRFLVTSDLHLRTTSNDYQSYDILQKLYSTAYAYSEAQDYNKLDGIFFAGDFTQNGSNAELQKFFDFVNANTKEETTVRAVLGNHEFWDTGRYTQSSLDATFAKYLQYGGYDEVDQHITIGGYHFLILNMDMYDGEAAKTSKYSAPKLAWLETELAQAAATDPAGTKPIFVFHHMPATGTVNDSGAYTAAGSRKPSDDNLEAIFNKYPQVVDFAGHTHCPITDPRSIWQGGFTAINTASLAYLGVPIMNHPTYGTKNVVAMDNNGSWAYGDIETSVRNAKLYYFIEVNADNELRVVVYNLASESVLMTIDLGGVGDPTKYTFTKERKQFSEAPKFPAGAALKVTTVTTSSAILEIPQASCPDTVNNYRCEVYTQDGALAKTVYRLACQYLGSAAPEVITAPITGCTPNTAYTVKVIPVNTWGVEGEPLTVNIKTNDLNGPLKADLFSFGFDADGNAINTITGKPLAITGNPTVTTDATLGKVGVVDGQSAWRFEDMPDLYALMSGGFSFETYVYLDYKPTSGYIDLVSNQQSGGFGFELKSTGKVHFFCHDGSAYQKPASDIAAGEWVHLVGVFNGSSVAIYMNGELAESVSAGPSLKPPSANAQYLCIGGDSDEGTGAYFMTGKIAAVKLYSFALSEQMIKTLYNEY